MCWCDQWARTVPDKDVYHELAGTIDTPEEYEKHRLQMAVQTWNKMKPSDSRECRNCHNFKYIDFTMQESRAAKEHQRIIDTNMTCIDCHQGIAHRLPEEYLQEYKRAIDELGMSKPQKDAKNDVRGILNYLNPQEQSGG